MKKNREIITQSDSRTNLQVSASIVEELANWMPRSSVRAIVNRVNTQFKEEKIPLKMTFSHETRKVRIKELKSCKK